MLPTHLSRAALRVRSSHHEASKPQETDGRVPLLDFCQFNVPRAHHEHSRTPTSATGQLPASDDRVPKHVALRFRCFVPRLRSAGSPVARGDCRGPHRVCSASHWACPRVRGTVALTPTSTTAHRGGFTPAGGGPDTSCHQEMLGSAWKSGPNVGAVDRLPFRGINWSTCSNKSSTS
jgi:hypothetical protein